RNVTGVQTCALPICIEDGRHAQPLVGVDAAGGGLHQVLVATGFDAQQRAAPGAAIQRGEEVSGRRRIAADVPQVVEVLQQLRGGDRKSVVEGKVEGM